MLKEKKSNRLAYRIITFIIITTAVATLQADGIELGKEKSVKTKAEYNDNSISRKLENLFVDIAADADTLMRTFLRPETERNPKKRLAERPKTTIKTDSDTLSPKAVNDKNKDKSFLFFPQVSPPRKYRRVIITKVKKPDKITNDYAFPLRLNRIFPEIGFVSAPRICGRSVNEDGNRSRSEGNGDSSQRPQRHYAMSAGKSADECEMRRDAFDSEWIIPNRYRSKTDDELPEVIKFLFDDMLDDVFKMKTPFSFTDMMVDGPRVILIKSGPLDSEKRKHNASGKINETRDSLLSLTGHLKKKRQTAGENVPPRPHCAKDYKGILNRLLWDKSSNDSDKRRVKKESNPLESLRETANQTLSTHGPENNVTAYKDNITTVAHHNNSRHINTNDSVSGTVSTSTVQVNNFTQVHDNNTDNINNTTSEIDEEKINTTSFEKNDKNMSVSAANRADYSHLEKKTVFTWPQGLLRLVSSSESTVKGDTLNKSSENIPSDLINLFDEMINYDEQNALQVSQSISEIVLNTDNKRGTSKSNIFLIILGVIPGIVGLVVVIVAVAFWIFHKRPAWASAASRICISRNETGIMMSQMPSSQQQPKSAVQC